MSGGAVSIIVVAAFLVSILSFVAAQIVAAKSGKVSKMDKCSEEVDELKDRLRTAKDRISVLEDENVHLMRKLMQNGG